MSYEEEIGEEKNLTQNKEDTNTEKKLENLIMKFNKYEIDENQLIDGINNIKNQLQIIRVFKIENGKVENGSIPQGAKLIELSSKNGDKYDRLCFTSFSESSLSKPSFETVAIPDEFMNIVRDCINSNQKLQINLRKDTSVSIGPTGLIKFMPNDKIKDGKTENISTSNEKLKEYSQKIEGYPTFKFYFPEDIGEYNKKNANVFELKKDNIQKIRVMISKCNSVDNLEADAKKWIEKNKVDAEMEEVLYKKEKIGNIPVEVYELKYINRNDLAHKIYKIGYINGCRVTISGSMLKGKEEIINGAFEKLKWEDTKKPVVEIKPIVIDCLACNTNFELKWNVPITEKTFYCKCPNCGMELKRGNPNYKE